MIKDFDRMTAIRYPVEKVAFKSGCNKTSRRFLGALKQAISAVEFPAITFEPISVTAAPACRSQFWSTCFATS